MNVEQQKLNTRLYFYVVGLKRARDKMTSLHNSRMDQASKIISNKPSNNRD